MIENLKSQIENDSFQKNNKEFIADFIAFMKSKDVSHYEFEGDNDYCGFTALIHDIPPRYCYGRNVSFEFAYDKDFVKIFTANHNGFWVPEYISLKCDEAKPILDILFERFKEWGGF